MIRLVSFFLPAMLKNWGILFLATLVSWFVLPKMGVEVDSIRWGIFFSFFFGSMMMNQQLLANHSWIRSLPVSKSNIYLSYLASSLLNLFIGSLATILFVVATVKSLDQVIPILNKNFLGGEVTCLPAEWMLVFISIGAIAIVTMYHRKQGVGQLASGPSFNRRKLVGMLVGLGILAFLSEYGSPFLIGILMLVGCWYFFFQALVRQLALYPKVSKWIASGIGLMVMLQLGYVYSLANRQLSSDRAEEILEASQFLGILGGNIDDRRLAGYVSQVKDPQALKELLSVHPKVLYSIDIKSWMLNQKNPELLEVMEHQLKRSSKTDPEFAIALLNHEQELGAKPKANLYSILSDVNYTPEQVQEMLKSNNPHLNALGLNLCEIHLDVKCITPIFSKLNQWKDRDDFEQLLILESFQTLSMIKNEWINVEYYSLLRQGKVSPEEQAKVKPTECHFTAEQDLSYISDVMAPEINHCVRKFALAKTVHENAHYGWIHGSYPHQGRSIKRMLNLL